VSLAVTVDDVVAAARRLDGIAHRTPVVTSESLDERTGASVFLKPENLQRMGAFKLRGAYNRIAQLDPAARSGGVVAFSSGNHAQGVALAARLLGLSATIVMPDDAPRMKLEATRACGAEVVLYDRLTANRAAIAQAIADERGATIVPPFDDPMVIAGAGTTALELLADTGPLDVLVVCLGGGGLLSGCAVVATALSQGIAVWGVEPEAGDDFVRSLAAGERVAIPVPRTIADGLQTTQPGVHTFAIVQALCAGVVTVSDEELRAAMRFAFERLKLVVEPSGAAALAAILHGKLDVRGKRVGVTITGGNVDRSTFAHLIAE
jgi:threonine dehydratase